MTTNVQRLIDTIGTPPAEVCLDWAWQLNKLAEEAPHLSDLNWSAILVDDSGKLSLAPNADADNEAITLTDLIAQLIQWSNVEVSDDTTQGGPIQKLSAETLEQHRKALAAIVASACTKPIHGSDVLMQSGLEESEELERLASINERPQATDDDAQQGYLPTAKPKQAAATPRTSSARAPSNKAPVKRSTSSMYRWGWGLAGLAGSASLLMLYWPSGSGLDSSSGITEAQPSELTLEQGKQRGRNDADSLEEILSVSTLPQPTGDITLNLKSPVSTAPQPEPETKLLIPADEHLSLSLSTSPADRLGGLSLSSQTLVAPEMSESLTVGSSRIEIASGNKTPLPQPQEVQVGSTESTENVTSLLAEAAKSDPKVKNIDADPSDSEPTKLPIQLLDIDSMIQVQEISAKVRVREPVWQLRISTTDAFSIDPPDIQRLTGKEIVSWTLTAKELKSRKDQEPTRVVVYAQLAGRRANIKWTIAAVCADLPAISVPLNDERLDLMLNMLQGYQQRLGTGVAELKSSMELPGLAREQKTLLTARRKMLENEGKLVTRARQIIADAAMFVSWMDRSIQMHGLLSDQVGGQLSSVLQIGELETTEL